MWEPRVGGKPSRVWWTPCEQGFCGGREIRSLRAESNVLGPRGRPPCTGSGQEDGWWVAYRGSG